jgi:hypothetical protein
MAWDYYIYIYIYIYKVRDKQLVMKQVHVLFSYVLVGGWIEWIILTIKACVCVKNNKIKTKSFLFPSNSAVTIISWSKSV